MGYQGNFVMRDNEERHFPEDGLTFSMNGTHVRVELPEIKVLRVAPDVLGNIMAEENMAEFSKFQNIAELFPRHNIP